MTYQFFSLSIFFVITNNVAIIIFSLIINVVSFFLIPRLKYKKYDSYEEKKIDCVKNDYALTIIYFILIIISTLDFFINDTVFLFSNITRTPLILCFLMYFSLIFILYPKYSSILWVNLYFRNEAYDEKIEGIVDIDENAPKDVDLVYVDRITFNHNEIRLEYKNNQEIVFDEDIFFHSFYNKDGRIIKYDVVKFNHKDKRLVEIKYKVVADTFKSYITLYKTKGTGRVFAIKVGKDLFESNFKPSMIEKIIDILIYILLFIVSQNTISFLLFIFMQYILLNRIFYVNKTIRFFIKIVIIILYLLLTIHYLL